MPSCQRPRWDLARRSEDAASIATALLLFQLLVAVTLVDLDLARQRNTPIKGQMGYRKEMWAFRIGTADIQAARECLPCPQYKKRLNVGLARCAHLFRRRNRSRSGAGVATDQQKASDVSKWSAVGDDRLALVGADVNGLNLSVSPGSPDHAGSFAASEPTLASFTFLRQPHADLSIAQVLGACCRPRVRLVFSALLRRGVRARSRKVLA